MGLSPSPHPLCQRFVDSTRTVPFSDTVLKLLLVKSEERRRVFELELQSVMVAAGIYQGQRFRGKNRCFSVVIGWRRNTAANSERSGATWRRRRNRRWGVFPISRGCPRESNPCSANLKFGLSDPKIYRRHRARIQICHRIEWKSIATSYAI
jgi:hypothetical protein